jgi:hypothetical protein
VRAIAARGLEVVACEVDAVGGQQRLGGRVVQRRPLEVEEQQRGLDRGALLLDALQQCAVRRVGGVDREREVRVGAGAAGDLLDLAELLHRRDQSGAVERGDVARVLGGERVSALLGLAQQGVDGGLGIVPSAVQQMGEIPLDRLQVGIGDGGFHSRTD